MHVALLGLGPTAKQFISTVGPMGGIHAFCDEVWGINQAGDIFPCDRVFHMDDVRIQQIRADARPESNIAALLAWLKTYKGRVITSRAHPDYPALEAFPLEEVVNGLGGNIYFNSTAAYAVAYAVAIGVKRLSLFGCDFSYANSHQAEKGRACVEFYLGMFRDRGGVIGLPAGTTLMDGTATNNERLYGYDGMDIVFAGDDDALEVQMTPRALPTAAEIEARYDHSRPTVAAPKE